MHTNQTFNSLTIENPEGFNWPEEVKPFLSACDWGKTIWNCWGLPAFQSAFCLTGTQLYFEGADQKIDLHKEDFTGQVMASIVINPKDHDTVYIVTFELIFYKGVLSENILSELIKKPKAEYDAGFRAFMAERDKAARIFNSFWFKYLYRPYYRVLQGITIAVVFVVQFLLQCFVWFVGLFLPIQF